MSKNKKIISLILSVIMLLSCISIIPFNAFASNKIGNNAYYTLDENGLLTISGYGDTYNSKIPYSCFPMNIRNKIQTVKVSEGITSIDDCMFSNCENLVSVSLPNSLTKIGGHAFIECFNLNNINIPSNITLIPKNCFYGCKKLSQIVLPEKITKIDSGAFCNCYNLKTINIPSNVTYIGDGAFGWCDNLERVNIKSLEAWCKIQFGIRANDANPLYNENAELYINNQLIKVLEIPLTITEILPAAFVGGKFTEIKFHNNIEKIGAWAFSGCNNLTEVTLPTKLTVLENASFCSCENLKNINFNNNLTTIETSAVSSCPLLTTIKIPDKVTTIKEYAFSSSKNLKDVYLPKNIKFIDKNAFSGYKSSDFTIHGYENTYAQQYAKDNGFKFAKITCTNHTFKTYTTNATTSKNGSIITKCTICGFVSKKTLIPYVKSISLSATSYTYDGKVKSPVVTVKDSTGKKLVKGTDYTVTYASGRKYVGKYAVKVTFKGKYAGTKTLYFTIKPKSTSISKITATKKGFKVYWKKQSSQTTGYQIQYATNSKFSSAKTVTVSKNSYTSKSISKLSAKKKYYVRVRTYKTINGTKYYSPWSKAKTVVTKK